MKHRLLVLSDIDGTLVPHPFLSGQTVNERQGHFQRLRALFRHSNFGLVTGRREEGYLRFFQEYAEPVVWPSILATENGTDLALRGDWVLRQPQSELLARVVEDIGNEVRACPEMNEGHDTQVALASGKIETYFLELKKRCAQIEVHFPLEALRKRFLHIVERHANPWLMRGLTAQCFLSEGRIDLWDSSTPPKTGFWPCLENQLAALGMEEMSHLTVVALGDEFYDAYLFLHLQSLRSRFAGVECIAVGRPLPGATRMARDVDEALGAVEAMLTTPAEVDRIVGGLECLGRS